MRRLFATAAAHAQNDGPQTESVLDGDYITLGAGGFYGPSYDGSDDYVLSPAPLVQDRLLGVAITRVRRASRST